MIAARPHIARMAPYPLANTRAPEGETLIALAQNESLRPASPAALQAASEAFARAELYPDSTWAALREALSERHDLDADGLLCGNGSLELIGRLAQAFAGPGRAVLAPAHAYPFFRTAAECADARFDTAPERDATVDVDALLSAVRPDTAIVFVANPGNPTGTRIAKAALSRLRAELREDVLLVIDEAYGEFADDLGERCFDMVADGRTVVLRTFSKAYGLAGLRVGWGSFPPAIARELRKVLNPSNVAAPSQAAAIGALADQAYMRETCAMTAALRAHATQTLRAAGFRVAPSVANFVLIAFPSAAAAESADAFLRAKGVFLRRQGGAGLPHALRMTIARRPALDAAIDRLTLWKQEHAT